MKWLLNRTVLTAALTATIYYTLVYSTTGRGSYIQGLAVFLTSATLLGITIELILKNRNLLFKGYLTGALNPLLHNTFTSIIEKKMLLTPLVLLDNLLLAGCLGIIIAFFIQQIPTIKIVE